MERPPRRSCNDGSFAVCAYCGVVIRGFRWRRENGTIVCNVCVWREDGRHT